MKHRMIVGLRNCLRHLRGALFVVGICPTVIKCFFCNGVSDGITFVETFLLMDVLLVSIFDLGWKNQAFVHLTLGVLGTGHPHNVKKDELINFQHKIARNHH